eukprot:1194608-Prorocentrum_minimum.AAC.8
MGLENDTLCTQHCLPQHCLHIWIMIACYMTWMLLADFVEDLMAEVNKELNDLLKDITKGVNDAFDEVENVFDEIGGTMGDVLDDVKDMVGTLGRRRLLEFAEDLRNRNTTNGANQLLLL